MAQQSISASFIITSANVDMAMGSTGIVNMAKMLNRANMAERTVADMLG